MLRNTQGRVTLLVSRQEQGGIEDEEEVRGETGGGWSLYHLHKFFVVSLCYHI